MKVRKGTSPDGSQRVGYFAGRRSLRPEPMSPAVTDSMVGRGKSGLFEPPPPFGGAVSAGFGLSPLVEGVPEVPDSLIRLPPALRLVPLEAQGPDPAWETAARPAPAVRSRPELGRCLDRCPEDLASVTLSLEREGYASA